MTRAPAFKTRVNLKQPPIPLAKDMTLRDWFAGQALAGDIAHHGNARLSDAAYYAIADAMLTEREKTGGNQ